MCVVHSGRIFFLFLLFSLIFQSAGEAADTVIVDFRKGTAATVSGRLYGLNSFQGFKPQVARNSSYRKNLAAMRAGMIRYHAMPMLEESTADNQGWLKGCNAKASCRWDADKITDALQNLDARRTVVMMNIPRWPAWMADSGGKLRKENYDDFAAFCLSLIEIVNKNAAKNVRYWEIMNEVDDLYKDDMGKPGEIFNVVARAIKRRYPDIKTGGPAFINPYNEKAMRQFLKVAAPELDFFSYHTYSTGDKGLSSADVWTQAEKLGQAAMLPARLLQEIAPQRKIELYHNEWNISWAPPDEKMTGMTGAIYDALAMASMAATGKLTGAMAWNEADGWYGKLNNDAQWTRRPASYIFQLFNTYMTGTVVSYDARAGIVVLAVKNPRTCRKSVAVINRSSVDRKVLLKVSGASDTAVWSSIVVGASGMKRDSPAVDIRSALLSGKDTVRVLFSGKKCGSGGRKRDAR